TAPAARVTFGTCRARCAALLRALAAPAYLAPTAVVPVRPCPLTNSSSGEGGRCRRQFVILAVTPIAGRGAEGARREPRPGRSGRRRGPGSTVRSSPRARLRARG